MNNGVNLFQEVTVNRLLKSAIIVSGASLAFASSTTEAFDDSPDVLTAKSILTQIGIPEQALWKIAEFKDGLLVRLDLSVGSQTIYDFTGEIPIEKVVYKYKRFSQLPEQIGHLKNLQTLILDGNDLQALPEQIGHLEHLETLSALNNRIETLPASLGKLKNLKSLILRDNRIREIPENIYNLHRLERFDISGNKIDAISSRIGELSSLKSLHLEGNKIKRLPENITTLHLKQFKVDHNRLQFKSKEVAVWVKANCDAYYE